MQSYASGTIQPPLRLYYNQWWKIYHHGETTNERDLGVQIDHDLKFDQQVEMVANKANKMLGLIRRSFTYLDGPTMKKLYTSLVRPI